MRLLFALVTTRALEPTSKLALESWTAEQVIIDGLDQAPADQLYRAPGAQHVEAYLQ